MLGFATGVAESARSLIIKMKPGSLEFPIAMIRLVIS